VLIVDLHLKGNLVIVIGSGNEGMKKVNSLFTQDCKILVIRDKSNSQIEKYVKQGKIQFKKTKLKQEHKQKILFCFYLDVDPYVHLKNYEIFVYEICKYLFLTKMKKQK